MSTGGISVRPWCLPRDRKVYQNPKNVYQNVYWAAPSFAYPFAYCLQVLHFIELSGAPAVIRTPDLLVRSQTLYPAELRAHIADYCVPTAYSTLRTFINRDFPRGENKFGCGRGFLAAGDG